MLLYSTDAAGGLGAPGLSVSQAGKQARKVTEKQSEVEEELYLSWIIIGSEDGVKRSARAETMKGGGG